MSMLAEPRRKQKLSIDPRGSNWSKDDSKFGQKMLEKFGWSKGKGLGAKEDGNVDHVKVSLKNNNHGLGCSKTQVDNWIAHQDDFNALLASLNQSNPQADTEKVISLENKSKTSRSRVHYQKFTKGKDLSAKSSEDLACIFGKRNNKKETIEMEQKEEKKRTPDNEPAMGGIITVKSEDSIQAYFAKKMASLKKNSSQSDLHSGKDNSILDESSSELHSILKYQGKDNSVLDDSSSVKHVSFMIGTDSDEKTSDNDENVDKTEEKRISKKSKKKKEKENNDTDEQSELLTKKKKSKKRKHDLSETKHENDLNTEVVEDEGISKKKKKKKKDKVLDDQATENSEGIHNCNNIVEKDDKKNKNSARATLVNSLKEFTTDIVEVSLPKNKNEKRELKKMIKKQKKAMALKIEEEKKRNKIKTVKENNIEVIVKEIEGSFIGSNMSKIEGYAIHSGFSVDLALELKKRKKTGKKAKRLKAKPKKGQ